MTIRIVLYNKMKTQSVVSYAMSIVYVVEKFESNISDPL